ncbi:MAG: hypothetical protein JW955_14335, partial [Sedimentisphaerales bacterium]|nr:hypothetical protein [Sedimentisphaerales bacterium]
AYGDHCGGSIFDADSTPRRGALLHADFHFRVLPDWAVWTSLCLYHDQVVVCNWPLGITRKVLKEVAAALDGRATQSLAPGIPELAATTDMPSVEAGIKFVDMLDTLDREAIIDANSWEWARRLRSGFNTVTQREMYDVLEAHPHVSTEHAMLAYAISHEQGYPIALDCAPPRGADAPKELAEYLNATLAQSAICQLALPDVKAIKADDLLEARAALKDELLEFRAGIRSLTWLLHQQLRGSRDLHDVQREADTLVNTKVAGALMSLENRMRQHKSKRIRRMLLGTGRTFAALATFSWASLGKAILTMAGEIDTAKPPHDQVATYLYGLKKKLR